MAKNMVDTYIAGGPKKRYRKTSIKRRVPNNHQVSNKRQSFEACVLINAGSQINKRPGLLEIQRCQCTSHTLVTSYVLTQIAP